MFALKSCPTFKLSSSHHNLCSDIQRIEHYAHTTSCVMTIIAHPITLRGVGSSVSLACKPEQVLGFSFANPSDPMLSI